MRTINCDVIIPVYNAVEDLKECVASLMKYTDARHRIIIVNDCSPDPQVSVYLDEIKYMDRIIVLENDINLGFVGTVNVGMNYSDRDVVLLNSDTVVTESWLEKMIDTAYKEDNIATVTPLTNNGTICSVPNFNEDNELPEGFTIDSFAYFIEKVSLRRFPELPTGVGFCMYIKRDVLQEVGLFDAEAFGKGYGEENDFCCRVIERGYVNVLADDTFIYHKGSMSFQGKKAELVRNNLKVLNQRYPYYEKKVHDFIFFHNPITEILNNIKLRMPYYINNYRRKGNILFLLHNFFDEVYNHPIGGTEYHVKDIVEGLDDYNCFILVSNGFELILKHYADGRLIGKYRFPLNNELTLTHFHHREYEALLEKIITTFDIGVVHIHHLRKHTFDIAKVASKFNLRIIMTLHDFYLICPSVNLLDEQNEYCIDLRGEKKCTNCLHHKFGFHTPFINVWRKHVLTLIELVDRFITPSDSTKDIFNNEFGDIITSKITVIPHGTHPAKNVLTRLEEKIEQKLQVGFLGGLSPTKGSKIIYDVITSFPKDKAHFHLIGGLGDQKLNLLEQSNLTKHGPYNRNNITEILANAQIDVICLLSPWPETYSYTLSESWDHGIPVLVTPMGALRERVYESGAGWVSKSMSSKDIIDSLVYISNLPKEEMKVFKEKAISAKKRNIQQMVKDYKELYDQLCLKIRHYGETFKAEQIIISLKYFLPTDPAQNIEAYNNKIHQLEAHLHEIKNTVGWKVLDVLRSRASLILKFGKKGIYTYLRFRR